MRPMNPGMSQIISAVSRLTLLHACRALSPGQRLSFMTERSPRKIRRRTETETIHSWISCLKLGPQVICPVP
jgi:hypothetical protein